MSLTREEVIAYLESLTAEELGELADELVRRLGLPGFVRPEPMRFTMGAPLPDPAECPEFFVVLHDVGKDKVAVVKAVRALWEIPLGEAKTLVESAPVVVRRWLSPDGARRIVDALTAAGANAEMRRES
ncbi:50S ribosomal protein L7/L12 [Polyangium sp. y55x31]|uniref:ribosomal protein bL12 n=1 Tax=Polyangium sp. y55x31 TaxID=3042688 RepID=UPI002482B9DF|nr:50S ribosomal protein L7/L12 [Polyangium sp. y55x31]MDI1479543.1 ribosomal protein L7/L12 [Polyangium sp. y55x31]